MKLITFIVSIALLLNACPAIYAQETPPKPSEVFENVELLTLNGKKLEKLPVRLQLEGKSLVLTSKKTGEELKTFNYDGVRSLEYSYSKHPRWKSGAGAAAGVTGAAVAISPYLLLAVVPWMAIPAGLMLARSKSKRHWLTIKTGDDYAVLKLDKDIGKLLLPAIETRTGLAVEDVGEKK